MSAIGAGDVTYALQEGSQTASADSFFEAVFSVAFGDSALTYPAGGIPLTKAKLGCPAFVKDFTFMDAGNANGFIYKYDRANEKLRIYQTAAQSHAHDFLVKGGTAAASTDALNIKATVIGKEAATDATNLAVDSATKGGVLTATLAAGAPVELSGSAAPAATTLYVKVSGF